jgi:hypothetical protein
MNPSVVSCAEGDQILFGIVPRLAAKLFVVDVEIKDKEMLSADSAI